MARSAAGCSPARSPRRRNSKATTCARPTRNSGNRGFGQYLAAVERLDRFARERYGKTVLALAVRWLLDRGKIVALWGARRPDQLAPVADVMGWTLDAAAMQEIDRILAETITDDVGPEFMAPQPSRPAEPSRQKRAS